MCEDEIIQERADGASTKYTFIYNGIVDYFDFLEINYSGAFLCRFIDGTVKVRTELIIRNDDIVDRLKATLPDKDIRNVKD